MTQRIARHSTRRRVEPRGVPPSAHPTKSSAKPRAGKPVPGIGAASEHAPAGEARRDALSRATWRSLDQNHVVYAPFADETNAQGNVRTNYAVVSDSARAVFLGLDNGNRDAKGYEGFSEAEKAFALDTVQYAKSKGYPVIVFAHIPPNLKGRHGAHILSPNRPRYKAVRSWIESLRESVYPNTLFVFGHCHPDKTRLDPSDSDVDFDGLKDGKADLDAIIMSGQEKHGYLKISLYERGKCLQDIGTKEGRDSGKPRGQVWVRADGTVAPSGADFGKRTGVVFGTSDVQGQSSLGSYFRTLAGDARAETEAGLPVYYLFPGDLVVKDPHIPVHLPQHQNLLWVPGNHCYTNHPNLNEVVDFLQPADGPVPMVVQYEAA